MGRAARQHIVAAVSQAHRSCDPTVVVERQVWDFVGTRPLFVLAVGKSAMAMAHGVAGRVPVAAGLIVSPANDAPAASSFERIIASHPFPDQRSERAARRASDFVRAVPAHGVLLALISGGTSSLLAAAIAGLDVTTKVQLIRALMAAGATITELNTVRAALSSVKAGGLVVGCAAPVVTWAISDVPGDDIGIIGSGPTVGDWVDVDSAMPKYAALPAAALRVVQRFGLELPGPAAVQPLRPVAAIRCADIARVVAPRQALADALTLALSAKQPVLQLSLDADIAVVAQTIVTGFAALQPGQWLVAHGEPTLRLPASAGPGGRMRDIALRLAIELAGAPIQGLALASDGCDGLCPVRPIAGAWFDATTLARAELLGFDVQRHRDNAASAEVFAALADEYAPGLTGQNYADVVVLQRLPG